MSAQSSSHPAEGTVQRKLFEHELEERLDTLLFAAPSRRSIAGLAAALEPLSRVRQNLVLHWVGVVSQTYAEIGYLIASLAPSAFELLDDAGFQAWVLAGLDTYDREGLRPAMILLRDLEGYDAARRGTPVAKLADLEARLTRYIQGLSGRPLSIRTAATAWTDTETLYLPESLAVEGDANGNRRLYKAIASLLWAQTRFGTFSVDLETELQRWPDRQRALEWLALIETVRLHDRLAAELPGLAAEIAAVRGPWPESLEMAVQRLGGGSTTITDTLRVLATYMESGRDAPRLPIVGTLDPAAARRVRGERIARETRVLRNALSALQGAGKRAGEESEHPLAIDVLQQTVELRIDGEVVTMPLEAQAAVQSLVQDLGMLPPEVLSPAGPGIWQPTEHVGPGSDLLADDRTADHYLDEWDYHRNAYRRGWCHVYETDVVPGDPAYVTEVRTRRSALIRQIRRRFEAMRGEDRILGRQAEGEDIDVDALVEAFGDRCSGAEPSSRLFYRRVRNQRSMAAMFMVDMSGSTKGWVNDAEREALVMLCEAVEQLGDRYAIYGFSGWTRTRCDIYRIKSFDECYDETVRARIAGVEAKDYTRMGVAIRYLSGLLAAQPARHRLLVSLTDGRPDDFGDEYRGHYGIEDTRRALQEARESGIRSYCVTIDRHGPDYLRHMYGPAAYTVLDDVKKLPLKLADIYRRLTS